LILILFFENFTLRNKVPYNIITSKDGDIDMFTTLKEQVIDLNKDTVQNINRIRSEQEVNSKKFNKEWNKWNTKTKIKRKPL
jgi:hypothetical protein